MTPEQLAQIKARDAKARVYPDPKDLLEWALSDCRDLIAYVDQLRAVITAADTLHSCAAGEHLRREAAWDAYCAARERLGEM